MILEKIEVIVVTPRVSSQMLASEISIKLGTILSSLKWALMI